MARRGARVGEDIPVTSESRPYRAVLFDADGVLQWPRPGWLHKFNVLGGPGFIKEAFAREKGTLTGELDIVPVIADLLAELGRDVAPSEVLDVWCDIMVDQEALDLVARLRASGVTTVLATNQQSYRGDYMQRAFDFDRYFDKQFFSYEVGLAKPDTAFFQHIADEVGLPLSEMFFVDDLQENVDGAAEAGLDAARHFIFGESDIVALLNGDDPELMARADEIFAQLSEGNAARLEALLRAHGIEVPSA